VEEMICLECGGLTPLVPFSSQLAKSCDKSQHSKKETFMLRYLVLVIVVAIQAVAAQAKDENVRTLIYDGIATEVAAASETSNDLWITTSDLARATRFVIKPQGVCRDELCFPLPKNRTTEFVSKRGATNWFNLSNFARLIKQPFVSDQKNGVWYFGVRAAEQNGYLALFKAPDFTLPDLNGKLHSLADFRGKKVLLVTWASW
jgi:hypothetical protein